MFSGAESELDGGVQGTEEVLDTGAEEGTQGTETGESVSEDGNVKWEDLDPTQFPEMLRGEVVKLNKAAVTQFQKKVQKLVEEGKPIKAEIEKLRPLADQARKAELILQKWVENPQLAINYLRQTNPKFFQSQTPQEVSNEDRQALELLRKAGLMTQKDIDERLTPVLEFIESAKRERTEAGLKQCSTEIDTVEKWCKEKSLPWSEEIALGCIGLISSGKAPDLKTAYETLYKPIIDKTEQLNFGQKKNKLTNKPTGGQTVKTTNLPLRQIIEQAMDDAE